MMLSHAEHLARELLDLLKPYCDRIEIAGGIRRKKPEPHDIEIARIPHFAEQMTPFGFSEKSSKDSLEPRIIGLLLDNVLQRGSPTIQNWQGTERILKAPCGPKYYRLKFKGEKVDIFAVTPPAQWGADFTIRTGDAEFSHWLVQQGYSKGIHQLDGHLEKIWDENGQLRTTPFDHGKKISSGWKREVLPTPEEKDYFETLGVKWVEPEKRTGWQWSIPKEALLP